MILKQIETLRQEGRLTEEQARFLSSREAGEPFSIHAEIRAFLYFGALFIAAGVGATVKTYFSSLGPWAITGGLAAGVLACLGYVFRRGAPWSRDAVPSPTPAFDYVLFLGCLLFSLLLGYAENRWGFLGGAWRHHFLLAAASFLFLAYRHDNRLVLSLGLSSLAAWVGLEFGTTGFFFRRVPWESAVGFGLFCLGAGLFLSRWAFKAHFQDVYLNFASLALGGGLLSQTIVHHFESWHVYALAVLCLGGAAAAYRARRFQYLLHAAFFGYVGLTVVVPIRSILFGFVYFTLSALALVGILFWASRRRKEDA